MQELEQIYQMFQHVLSEKVEDYEDDYSADYKRFKTFYNPINGESERALRYFDSYDNEFNASPRFFSFMLALRGFTAFPTYLTDEAYGKLKKLPLYHGFKEFEHGASLLSDKNYHYGTNDVYGTYFSSSINEASTYLCEFGKKITSADMDRVLEIKLISDNFIDKNDLHVIIRHIDDPYHIISDEDEIAFKNLNLPNDKLDKINNLIQFKDKISGDRDYEKFIRHMNTPQILATYLGYDFIKVYKDDILNTIVLNRSAIAVSESEFRKFVDNSKSYKGDSIIPENNI